MQQQTQQEESQKRGLAPEQYQEVVRRAELIRAEREGRMSRETFTESAAELGIAEADLLEAERQLEAEKLAQTRRRSLIRTISLSASALVLLLSIFSYNSLNGEYQAATRAKADLQTTLQRRADLIPQVARVTREGAQQEKELADRLARARQDLQSKDLATQMRASSEVSQLAAKVRTDGSSGTSELYRDFMIQLEGSENRIAVSRRKYNDAANHYNLTAQRFPTSLIRPVLGFPGQMPYLQPPVNVDQPPRF